MPECHQNWECKEELNETLKGATEASTEALCWKLYLADIIGNEDRIKVTGISAKKDDCCTELLVSSIEKAISEDAQKFDRFQRILERDYKIYHKVIVSLKKAKSMKTTMLGKNRPSSLSLQNYSSSSQVLRPAMCKANRSMVVVTKPRRPSIPCSSKVVHSQFSNESVQTYQRRRESVPQLASGLQVAKVRRASVIGGVYVTDAAGNTKRLASSPNTGHSPTHKLPLSNNSAYGGVSLKLIPEKSPAQTYGTQEVPEQKVFKVKTTTYPVKYSPKRNLPSPIKYFRQLIGVVDSPPVSPHSQGATSSSSEEKTALIIGLHNLHLEPTNFLAIIMFYSQELVIYTLNLIAKKLAIYQLNK